MSEFIDPEHGSTVSLDPCGASPASGQDLSCTWPKGHAPILSGGVAVYDHADGNAMQGWYLDESGENPVTMTAGFGEHPGVPQPMPDLLRHGVPGTPCREPGPVSTEGETFTCVFPSGHVGMHRCGSIEWGYAADPGKAERMDRLRVLPDGSRVIALSELPEEARRIVRAIFSTAQGEGCGERDACKLHTAEQAEDAMLRAATSARVRVLSLPIVSGVVLGSGRVPFVLVVDQLGTMQVAREQETFWTEHGKAMGAVRTIVACGTIDLDDAQL